MEVSVEYLKFPAECCPLPIPQPDPAVEWVRMFALPPEMLTAEPSSYNYAAAVAAMPARRTEGE